MIPTGEELTVSRVIRARIDRVFSAWTDPAQIVRWWGAGGVTCPEAEMDLRVGGRYRIANRMPTGETAWITGTFSLVDPPRRLDYSWIMEPRPGAETDQSLVEVRFTAIDDGTEVSIRQTRIPGREARDVHLQGWIGCLEGLDRLIGAAPS